VIARGVPHTPKMNKTEAGYGFVLEAEKRTGKVREYHFQGITLKLGDDCRYTPDYLVVRDDWTCELHEVKGFMRDDSLVKLKVCARMYPFRVLVVRKTTAGFERTPVAP
jgi:hypothetical protein